ncbi:hypothetical protein [Prosthecobacter sp.]|uniref:hypothetical protein n=1 Tax=Prosthecobacter sp. TaxID=1965333 RepID=UPI00248843AD|nr:hypothetical protein [Prosthecobacter sp.]MDI1313380.1 hypothetical protein [Prosthecobacter sp.]
MKSAAPISKRRRLWRWTWRLGLTGLILLTLLVGLAWHQRVPLANALLHRFLGDMQVEVVSLDWHDGALHVREVSTLDLPSSKHISSVANLEWRPNWSQLSQGNLGGLKVEDAVVDVPLAWLLPSPPQPAALTATATSSFRWRLDLIDLAPTKFVVRDENWLPLSSVIVTQKVQDLEVGGSKSPSFKTVITDLQQAEWHGLAVFSSMHLETEMRGSEINIKKASLKNGNFDLAWLQQLSPALRAKLPPLRGGLQFEWDGRDIRFSNAGLLAGGTHEVHLKNLHLQPLTGAGQITATSLDLKASQDLNGLWHVERALLQKPVVEWTPELESALLPKRESKQASAWQAKIDALQVQNGTLKLTPTELSPVAGELAWSTNLEALGISPAGLRSAVKQKLTLTDVSLRWNPKDTSAQPPPFVQAKSATLEVVPDSFRELWQVESLVLNTPHLTFNPENGPWFDKIETPPVETSLKPALPWWKQLQFGSLTVTDAELDIAMQLAERLESSTHFAITTEQSKQHLRIHLAQMYIPKRSTLPVLTFANVEALASLPEMWRTQRLESLKIQEGHVALGDPLMTLFSGDAAVVEQKADATAARWTAGKIEVVKLGITLVSIAPGLPPVSFDVNLAANETPLDLDGLAKNVEPQTIQLTRLRIPSPHEALRTVAEMDVIQVNYTLDGLLHRRIDRVEIVSPILYVGEDLFWYVENYRKSMHGEAPIPDATFGPPEPPKPTAPGWQVDTLAVTDGKLIIAPKGVPLAGISRPFPFSFTSKLESGQLDAQFNIPTDDYTLKDLKLEFRGMKGLVHFNLPLKDRSNNLTETFSVQQLRWKQLHFENAHLSVTYDAHGIYGLFGSSAYGGYVNGAFDIYLDETFTWDGWVAGTDVDLQPITTTLFPEYFLIDGKVQGKIIATGNKNELYQGDAEFKNRSHGKFSIAALNNVIKSLPKALTGTIGDQITRIGLETLRDFEYENIDGKARFYGREGRGHLRFSGPKGSRKFEVNVYDHRWKVEPLKSETADALAR